MSNRPQSRPPEPVWVTHRPDLNDHDFPGVVAFDAITWNT